MAVFPSCLTVSLHIYFTVKSILSPEWGGGWKIAGEGWGVEAHMGGVCVKTIIIGSSGNSVVKDCFLLYVTYPAFSRDISYLHHVFLYPLLIPNTISKRVIENRFHLPIRNKSY